MIYNSDTGEHGGSVGASSDRSGKPVGTEWVLRVQVSRYWTKVKLNQSQAKLEKSEFSASTLPGEVFLI